MNFANLKYYKKSLFYEGVELCELAKKEGTPLYVYSLKTIKDNYLAYQEAKFSKDKIISYAVKANGNLRVLKELQLLGAGADIVSGGELRRALHVGMDPRRIVFSGVCKTEDEIKEGLHANILMFNVESIRELYKINEIAAGLKCIAPISLRINPDVDAKTHPYISTGFKKNKFGLSEVEVHEILKNLSAFQNIKLIGLSTHIGSQLTKLKPFEESIDELVRFIKNENLEIKYLDVGGGLGITYHDEEPPSIEEYISVIDNKLANLNLTVIFEPGRSIIGNAGLILGKIHYVKNNGYRTFYISDIGMNDNLRPSLYEAHHEVLPCIENNELECVDVVGPICESADTICEQREISKIEEGAYFAVLSAGAYGSSMASNYNSRPMAAEILIDGSNYSIIRKKQSFKDLIEGENL